MFQNVADVGRTEGDRVSKFDKGYLVRLVPGAIRAFKDREGEKLCLGSSRVQPGSNFSGGADGGILIDNRLIFLSLLIFYVDYLNVSSFRLCLDCF